MEADDFSENYDSAAGCMIGENDLEEFALHLSGRLCDAGCTYYLAGDWGEPGQMEFIDFGADFGCGRVGCSCDGVGDDVDDEFPGLFNVAEGVFPVVSGGAQGGAKEDCRGVGADSGEEAERRDVGKAVAVYGRDESDWTRYDESSHQLVDFLNRVFARVDGAHTAIWIGGLGHLSSLNAMAEGWL